MQIDGHRLISSWIYWWPRWITGDGSIIQAHHISQCVCKYQHKPPFWICDTKNSYFTKKTSWKLLFTGIRTRLIETVCQCSNKIFMPFFIRNENKCWSFWEVSPFFFVSWSGISKNTLRMISSIYRFAWSIRLYGLYIIQRCVNQVNKYIIKHWILLLLFTSLAITCRFVEYPMIQWKQKFTLALALRFCFFAVPACMSSSGKKSEDKSRKTCLFHQLLYHVLLFRLTWRNWQPRATRGWWYPPCPRPFHAGHPIGRNSWVPPFDCHPLWVSHTPASPAERPLHGDSSECHPASAKTLDFRSTTHTPLNVMFLHGSIPASPIPAQHWANWQSLFLVACVTCRLC